MGLEAQPQLSLKGPGARLCGDVAKGGTRATQRQTGIRGLRVVEDVEGINAQLKTFGFRNPEGLTHRPIETPGSRHFQYVLPECSTSTGLGVLQHDLSGSIRNRIERTNGSETRARYPTH